MYTYGPEIAPETVVWLQAGAVFPDRLEVHTRDSGLRVYRILDRDIDGVVTPLKTGRRGKKGFVLRVQDIESDQELAAKLCIPSDYDGTNALSEVEFGSKLRGGEDLILLPHLVGRVDRFAGEPVGQDSRPWFCFISNWLTGLSLDELVHNAPERITSSLVAKIAKELITAVIFMEGKGVKHDDLTLGNLMLVDGDPDLAAINPERGMPSLRLIDLGSAKHVSRITGKVDDDWSNVARCLSILHNVLHRNRAEASRHPEFIRRFEEFILALSDEDLSRNFPSKADYVQRLLDAEETISIESRPGRGFGPLDAISAEHLASDELLLKLFVEHLPWISMVEQKGPMALIGPRGCGKSMVFRYLAARTHINSRNVGADLLDRTSMFGVYIGCASDLGNDLIWIHKRSGAIDRLSDAVIDYFNIVLTRELLRSLASAGGSPSLARAVGITDASKRAAVDFIQSAFGESLRLVCVGGMDQLQACADALDRLRIDLSRAMRNDMSLDINTGATFLRDLCRLLVRRMPGLERYTITFLLDDYTAHRLSKPVQSILNAVAFQRDASHLFKISSEPFGFEADHFYDMRVDANREYLDVDAGRMVLEMQADQRRQFVTELLNKRLSAAGYAGSADTLIGNSTHKDDESLADAIRSERKGKKTYYNGLHVLGNAWSGDVATVLHMVRNMFAESRVVADSTARIPDHVQHEAIVRVSKGLRGRVASYYPYGAAMNNILVAFGDAAHTLLLGDPARSKDGRTVHPHRKYRIEMTLPEGTDLETELTRLKPDGEVLLLYRELVRRAVFHELAPSRGKEGPGRRTVRLQVRASFLPSFGTSLVRHNHLKIARIEDFIEFLTEPGRWAQGVISRYKHSGGLFDTLQPEEQE